MARKQDGWTLTTDPRTGTKGVRFRHAGRRYHRSTGRRDRSEAQGIAAQIYEAVTTGRVNTAPRSLVGQSVEELVGGWLEAAEKERRPATLGLWELYADAHWVPFFRDGADLMSPAVLARYVSLRLGQVTASTVRKECSALQSLLRWCARPDVGLIEKAPTVPRPPKGARGTPASAKTRVDLTPAQVEVLIEALPEHIRGGAPCRAFFRVLWETGLRRGTLLRLVAPGDYHHGAESLCIRDESDKAAYGRELPLTDAARAALDSVCPAKGPIFEPADYRYQLAKAAKAAGIPKHLAGHVSAHDFRHARTTDLLDRGASLTGVAYLVGHRRVSTTDGYTHARESAAREALALDTGHRSGHELPGPPVEATKPARAAGSFDPSFAGLCGREDSNLHILSDTRSLGERAGSLSLVFSGSRGSEGARNGPETTLSGHRVPLLDAAIRYCDAVSAEDPHALSRGLDLVGLLSEVFAAEEEDEVPDVG